MGKIKHTRKKCHFPSVANRSQMKEPDLFVAPNSLSTRDLPPVQGNMFSQVPIDVNRLAPLRNVETDTQSLSNRINSHFGKKKDMRKLRRDAFLQKLNKAQEVHKEAKKREKKQKQQGNFYLQTLDDALPTLEALRKDTATKGVTRRISSRPRFSQSHRSQMTAMLNDMEQFQNIIKNPTFQADPLSSIKSHLEAKIHQGF